MAEIQLAQPSSYSLPEFLLPFWYVFPEEHNDSVEELLIQVPVIEAL